MNILGSFNRIQRFLLQLHPCLKDVYCILASLFFLPRVVFNLFGGTSTCGKSMGFRHGKPLARWGKRMEQVHPQHATTRLSTIAINTLWLCKNSYWKLHIYSGFTHWKLWFSIVMWVYQRVYQCYAAKKWCFECWSLMIASFDKMRGRLKTWDVQICAKTLTTDRAW